MAAIGRIILPALSFVPLDGTGGNLPPSLDLVQSTGGAGAPRFPRWTFSVATPELLCVTFRMPADFVANAKFLIDWYTALTTGDIMWRVNLACLSRNDGTIIPSKAPDANNIVITNILGNANRLAQDSIALTNDDNVTANDLVMLIFSRDPTQDSGEGDTFFIGGILEYDTSA